MNNTANRRIGIVALIALALDQITKFIVNRCLTPDDEIVVVKGFFKFVNWWNTGASWSLFTNNNGLLAIVAVVALCILFRARHHFEAHTVMGQFALGLVFGGIIGNLVDRLHAGHVTDFLRFYIEPRGGREIGFPAFNVADSAICVGVGLIFLLSLRNEKLPEGSVQPPA